AVCLAGLPPSRGDSPLPGKAPTFERDVLPLLKANCLKCHGGDARKGGLDLRNPAAMLAGGDNGPVLVKGDAEKSLLFQQVSARKMPPGKAAKLSDAQIGVLRDWINTGAAGSGDEAGFWAFRPVVRSPLPSVQHADRLRTPIDAFVLAKLEEQGFT